MKSSRPTAVTVIYCDATNEYKQAEVTEFSQDHALIQCGESVEIRTEQFSLTDEGAARRCARMILAHQNIVVRWEPPV